jgi:transposase-like protein
MTEIDTEVVRRLVKGHKNDGRAVYDPQAKAEVVRACMRPGVSVARMALQCGINANLLRRWIAQSMGVSMKASSRATVPAVAPGGSEAFIALQLAAPKAADTTVAIKVRLQARLPNGVGDQLQRRGPG